MGVCPYCGSKVNAGYYTCPSCNKTFTVRSPFHRAERVGYMIALWLTLILMAAGLVYLWLYTDYFVDATSLEDFY